MAKSKAKKLREKMVKEGKGNPEDRREFFPNFPADPFYREWRFKQLRDVIRRVETKYKKALIEAMVDI